MADESRIFWVDKSSDSTPDNEKTFLGGVPPAESADAVAESVPRMSMREQFSKHYDKIREWLDAHSGRSGVVLVAMSRDAVHGAAFLAAKEDAVSTAILGRHSEADLRLQEDASISLRHVALLLFPDQGTSRGIRYRLLDLRTATAFLDERGKRLRALEADGPAFVQLGRYTLLIFPTSEADEPWPGDAEPAWACVPDRLYLDEVETEEKAREWEADSDRAWEIEDLPGLSEPPTLVHNVAGPQMAVHELVDKEESVLGKILITSSRGAATIVLGRRAVQNGILLGRSRRCDAGKILSNRTISRVHILIIEIAGKLYAIDTASSNGVFRDEEQERATRLEPGEKLSLSDVATIELRTG